MAITKRRTDDFRVTCFSRSHNSVLMWAHYTNNHNGCLLAFHSGVFIEKTDIIEYKTAMNEIDLKAGHDCLLDSRIIRMVWMKAKAPTNH